MEGSAPRVVEAEDLEARAQRGGETAGGAAQEEEWWLPADGRRRLRGGRHGPFW